MMAESRRRRGPVGGQVTVKDKAWIMFLRKWALGRLEVQKDKGPEAPMSSVEHCDPTMTLGHIAFALLWTQPAGERDRVKNSKENGYAKLGLEGLKTRVLRRRPITIGCWKLGRGNRKICRLPRRPLRAREGSATCRRMKRIRSE